MQKIISWWKNNEYAAVVFVTGAAILVVEVTATRILSPYYGNTIYTVSSVISVILGALSVGYWRGGAQADSKPFPYEFYRIIYRSGQSLLVLFFLVLFILPIGGYFFSLTSGPLVWAIILFFPPSYLLGMLSPYSITLSEKRNPSKGLGHVTGSIFFWSTAGSIAGSLLTGFVFIPHFGVHAIIFGTTLTILLLGGIGLYRTEATEGVTVSRTRFILLMIILVSLFLSSREMNTPNIRFSRDGVYEHIAIIDQSYAGKPARFFVQDKSMSGAMFLDSDEMVFDYTKYYSLYKLFAPELSRALAIGGGAYSIPKAIHHDWPRAVIDVAEIEPGLEDLARKYFRLPETKNIMTHVADGRRLLHDTQEQYDMIFSDVYYSLYSLPSHFTTREFFREAREKLRPDGIFIANVIGTIAPTQKDSFLYSEIRTMREVFPNMSVFAVNATTSPIVQNFILVGINGDKKITDIPDNITETEKEFLLSLPEHKMTFEDGFLERYPILTDDHAPVEYLIASTMDKLNKYAGNKNARSRPQVNTYRDQFSEEAAMKNIRMIVGMGSRAVNSEGHEILREFIEKKLAGFEIKVDTDRWTEQGKNKTLRLTNIIARINPEERRRVIIGTHYDSIARAYRDKDHPDAYMPGANNGASGVAILLEAAAILRSMTASSSLGIDMIFFDGEEGVGALGDGEKQWRPLGSSRFASSLRTFYPDQLPEEAIILDMVCDKDLSIFPEEVSIISAPQSVQKFWTIGKFFSPDGFRSQTKYSVGDDHFPLIANGIPSFLVIDFEFEPWWNTTKDTPDKCSLESLDAVGNTLISYIGEKIRTP